ncbi:MAG: DUF4412 domain-containing protein [Verrucomicrobiota bacterium]
MKTLFPLAAVSLLLAAGAFADTVIIEKIDSGPDSNIVTLKFRNDKIRSDIAPNVTVITDIPSGDGIVLRHLEKNYQKFSAARTKEVIEKIKLIEQKNAREAEEGNDASPTPTPTPEPAPVLSPTGKKEIINGYEAEAYTLKSSTVDQQYWLTQAFPNWQNVRRLIGKAQEKTFAQLSNNQAPDIETMPGMPIKVETMSPGKVFTITVLSVKDETLEAKDFEIPKGYTKFTISPAKDSKSTPAPK